MQAQIDALRSKVTERETAKPATRAELDRLVDDGRLSRDQADAIFEKQIVDRAKQEATAEVDRTMTLKERSRRVESELSGYKDLLPEVWADGTPEREKVAREFQHLVGLGYPSTKETEAAALRAAFGDLDTLRASKSARRGPAETHGETGGGKPPAEGKGGDALKSLSVREKEHYQRGIDSGRYKDWDAVKDELKHANPTLRRKMGAKV